MDPTLLRNLLVLVRMGIVTVGLLAGYLAFYYLIPYLTNIIVRLPGYFFPFIVALFMAILIEPLIKKIRQKIKVGRGAAAIISLLIVWGSVSLVFTLIVSRLVVELIQLYRFLSGYSGKLSLDLASAVERIQSVYLNLNLPPQVSDGLLKNLGGVVEWLSAGPEKQPAELGQESCPATRPFVIRHTEPPWWPADAGLCSAPESSARLPAV